MEKDLTFGPIGKQVLMLYFSLPLSEVVGFSVCLCGLVASKSALFCVCARAYHISICLRVLLGAVLAHSIPTAEVAVVGFRECWWP